MRRRAELPMNDLIQVRVLPEEKQAVQDAAAATGKTVSDFSREAMLTMARPTRLWPKGQRWAEYNEIVPAGVSLKAVMTLAYWGDRARQFRPFDVVNCMAEDGSFDAQIRFLSRTSDAISFRVIHLAECADGDAIQRESLAQRFVVVRTNDVCSVFDNFRRAILATGLDERSAEAERQRIIAREAA